MLSSIAKPALSILAILLAAIFSAVTPTVCGGELDPGIYRGISESLPTGAPGISHTGLVGAYDMSTRTSDGRLRDFSTLGHHGRIQGTPRDTPGLWGGALSFPTSADRVDLPETAALDIDGPLSVLVWFRLDTLGLHQHVLACDDKFAVWLTRDDLLRFVDTVGDGAMTSKPLTAGHWLSVAAVYEGTKGTELTSENIRIYIDGKQVAVDLDGQYPAWLSWLGLPSMRPVWNPGPLHKNNACFIGFESHQGATGHQGLRFGGAIDEVLIFNRAVTNQEIALHAARPR